MRFILKLLLFTPILFVPIFSFAQPDGVEFFGFTYELGDEIGGVKVTVDAGSERIRTVTTDDNGEFTMGLRFGKNYLVSFEKEGYATKKIVIKARGITKEMLSPGFEWDYVEVSMLKIMEGIDYSALDKPVGEIYYDPDYEGFTWDAEYTLGVQQQLADLNKHVESKTEEIAEKEAVVQKEYNSQMKAGNKALNKGDYSVAKAAFEKASQLMPEDNDAKAKLSETTNIEAEELAKVEKEKQAEEEKLKAETEAAAAKELAEKQAAETKAKEAAQKQAAEQAKAADELAAKKADEEAKAVADAQKEAEKKAVEEAKKLELANKEAANLAEKEKIKSEKEAIKKAEEEAKAIAESEKEAAKKADEVEKLIKDEKEKKEEIALAKEIESKQKTIDKPTKPVGSTGKAPSKPKVTGKTGNPPTKPKINGTTGNAPTKQKVTGSTGNAPEKPKKVNGSTGNAPSKYQNPKPKTTSTSSSTKSTSKPKETSSSNIDLFNADYKNKEVYQLATEKYPLGMTEEVKKLSNKTITVRIVKYAEGVEIYRHVKHSWGGQYYFKNDQTISAFQYQKESNPDADYGKSSKQKFKF